MSEKCGGLVTKNGNLYLRQSGFNFGSICLSICLLAGLHKCYCIDLHEQKKKKNRRWKLILDHINFFFNLIFMGPYSTTIALHLDDSQVLTF